MRIAHVSDIHVRAPGSFHGVSFKDLLWNKRITGLLNMMTKRRGAYSPAVLQSALTDMQEQGVDHGVVTGDLTNLSLPAEFHEAHRLLQGRIHTMSIVPGNHDVYTQDAQDGHYFARHFGIVPFARRPVPQLEVIGLNSAIPQRAFKADGVITDAELEKAKVELMNMDMSSDSERKGREGSPIPTLRILALHHPPVLDKHGLSPTDCSKVATFCQEHSIDLVLHGHTHRPSADLRLPGNSSTLCIEAGALTWTGRELPPRYHIYDWQPGERVIHVRARVWRGTREQGHFDDVEVGSYDLPSHSKGTTGQ